MAVALRHFLRLKQVMHATAMSRSWIYDATRRGHFPSPVRLGARAVGWISTEVESVNAARIAGKTDAEIRELVRSLETARKSSGTEVHE